MKHLYKNFLQDQRVYNLNEAFYKRLVEAVTGSEAFHFFRSRYANGQKIYDGHIFSIRLVEKTAFEEISSMLPGSPMSNYENSNPAPVVNDDGE